MGVRLIKREKKSLQGNTYLLLVVFDTEAEADNGDFNEALESDQQGSGLPPLIEASSTESTHLRNAITDVLNGHNDLVHFIFSSSLQPMNVNHERNLEPNSVVTRRRWRTYHLIYKDTTTLYQHK